MKIGTQLRDARKGTLPGSVLQYRSPSSSDPSSNFSFFPFDFRLGMQVGGGVKERRGAKTPLDSFRKVLFLSKARYLSFAASPPAGLKERAQEIIGRIFSPSFRPRRGD